LQLTRKRRSAGTKNTCRALDFPQPEWTASFTLL
jgi:hypothetical protein